MYEGDQVTLPKRRPLSHHRHPINGSVPQKRWRNLVVVESNQESFILLKEEMTFLHPRGSVVANNQAGEQCFDGNVIDNNAIAYYFCWVIFLAAGICLQISFYCLVECIGYIMPFIYHHHCYLETHQMSCTASFVHLSQQIPSVYTITTDKNPL